MNESKASPAAKSIRFELGTVVGTPAAVRCLRQCGVDPDTLLARHQSGDWGELTLEDRNENERSVISGLRILSSYPMANGESIWIITEADRSATTFLLPEEY